eukprot:10303517-Ditylum_brightwellii.AAC.1
MAQEFNLLQCNNDKETLPYKYQDYCYKNLCKSYLQWDGTFTEQPIEEIESCNGFVAALKSCTPFQ